MAFGDEVAGEEFKLSLSIPWRSDCTTLDGCELSASRPGRFAPGLDVLEQAKVACPLRYRLALA